MKRTVILFFILLIMLLTGCETVKGVGRDMQKAGNWVEETAK